MYWRFNWIYLKFKQTLGCSLSLFFPDRVHIITWNVGSATPPDDITALLGLNVGDGNTDMYIIGWANVFSCPLQTVPLMSDQTDRPPPNGCDAPLILSINPEAYYLLVSSLIPVCSCLCVTLSSRLQEVNSMINKRLKDVLFTDQWSEVCMERLSPFGYVLVSKKLFHVINTYARFHNGAHTHWRTDESLDCCDGCTEG